MTTLDRDGDPERWTKLYRLDLETTNDIPMTAPWPVPTFDEWMKFWFDHPGHRPERFWIAREGDEIVGLSVIGYPPVRGIPWTSFTCTARRARGRGIARALKYASVRQAIELGATEVETQNDAENAPILHLNQEMGYRPAMSLIEMHKNL
jgi:RimJ/RimL family protein N-acetyltransferase